MKLTPRCFSLITEGLYLPLQTWSVWLRKCSSSITYREKYSSGNCWKKLAISWQLIISMPSVSTYTVSQWKTKNTTALYTLVTDSHISLYGGGKGSGFLATLRASRWHMLSYPITMFGHSSLGTSSTTDMSHTSTMVNTCEHDSELPGNKHGDLK